MLLAATDPAQPYGAALAWPDGPGRPARQAGAFVVLVDGALAAFLERGARSLLTFGVDAGDVGRRAGLAHEGRAPPQDRADTDRRRARR